ncbi:uncharacterized protein LOC128201663 [Galleria mellonella]|uniref:Uncharacterized protein LOC128201663 n=1 Tax=Galleria mellonella TaxID=7137 RepID=A0ABM3MV95_GALME|nr:uncharacterized protein LOC128201663 [Galleria mellonella]XP_052755280.1 uncharacterized protein LOC128201663 [Galleria mellonella]XP_052755284.1 uncharacterized protein LOC128201663 [Galleria mellonella]
MFCIQETEPHMDPFSDKDPLNTNTPSESSDDEPNAKRLKTYGSPSLNLKVYQIPAFNTPSSLSIFPTTTNTLPKFVNNPLNLANPLSLTANNIGNSVVKSLHSRYSLPSKLTITPVPTPTKSAETGEVVRYKKNGEIAKKRGPPKGYKRKPKVDLSCSLSNGALLQAQNSILTSLLAASKVFTTVPPTTTVISSPAVPKVTVPEGTELVELLLDPEDWFPAEPYKMVFSRKKNPKWKNFPYRCEHCFKGYRVVSTLVTHAAERHGSVPRELAIPCPCCPHVSTRRKHHKKHLESHEGRRHRIFCYYCLPPHDPSEPYVKESEKYPFDKFPQYWYASEESLRLHKKRKHPYAAMFNYNWFCTWGEGMPNS